MESLVEHLIRVGVLRTPHIIEAFRAIDRKDFVQPEYNHDAYFDTALPIGFGQTISQPYTVAFMFELLDPQPGQKILDVGFGSGWQTALLGHIVWKGGKVYAVERIPELHLFGTKNIKKYNFLSRGIVKTFCKNAKNGLPNHAPFDRIIAAASLRTVPSAWQKQLKAGGRIVAPIEDTVTVFTKKDDTTFIHKTFPGFAFVPFVSK